MKKTLIINASQIATSEGYRGRKGAEMKELLTIEDGAIYIEDGIIKDVGNTKAIVSKINIEQCNVIN